MKPPQWTAPKRIKTLAALDKAASQKRAVFAPATTCFRKPLPAAFIMSMQARIVHDLIARGLYIYSKQAKLSTELPF